MLLWVVVAPAHATWKGEVEFGLVATRGNSDTESFNLRFLAVYDRPRWRQTLRLDAVRASKEDDTTAERYVFEADTNYKLTEVAYLFGNLRYDKDRFSGFDFQRSTTGGYGRRWRPTDQLLLELQGGAGVRQSRIEGGKRENEDIVRGAFLLNWSLSENAEFQQRLTVEGGEDNTLTESVTSLKTKIVRRLAMKLNLTVKRNSEVPANRKNTDTFTSVNLVYDF